MATSPTEKQMAMIIVCFGVAGVHFGGSHLPPAATAREKSFVSVMASWLVMTAVVVWESGRGAMIPAVRSRSGMRRVKCTLKATSSLLEVDLGP